MNAAAAEGRFAFFPPRGSPLRFGTILMPTHATRSRASRHAAPPKVLGLVADTHGYFDPQLETALAGVDRIVHAGDIGGDEVLQRLERIAPVTAIRGNIDGDDRRHPAQCLLLWQGLRIRIVHALEEWEEKYAELPADVVVCGHSHRAMVENRDGVLIVNPGSAGKARFKLGRSCARLWRVGETVEVEGLPLGKAEA